MRLVHRGNSRGGSTRILAAPDVHVEKYTHFLTHELKLDIKKFPKLSRKAVFLSSDKKYSWVLPPARGTKKTLVMAPGVYPCNLCDYAEYNHLCQHQQKCAAFVYWTMYTAGTMHHSGLEDLKKAFLRQFRKKKKT